jgi:hypothetical protein
MKDVSLSDYIDEDDLMGMSHEMDLAFDDMHGHWSVLVEQTIV